MFRTVPVSIIRSFSLYTQQWYMSYRFADSFRAGSGRASSWFYYKNLSRCTVTWTSNSSMPNRQRKHISIGTQKKKNYKTNVAAWYNKTCREKWHIPLLCVQWKTPDDGQWNCLKHVEFYSKNKFEKLVHLVVFITRVCNKFCCEDNNLLWCHAMSLGWGLPCILKFYGWNFDVHRNTHILKSEVWCLW